MAGNPSYSGVPNGVAPGTAVQTGGAGTSRVTDYQGMPVYRQAANGQWIQLPADYEIPAGATVSIGAPPASTSGGGGSGDTVTGYGIVDQAETNRHNVETEGNARAQTANQAAATAAQSAASERANQIAQQQLQLDQQKAENQFRLDTQKFGLDQARFNFDQNVAQADAKYKQATLGLQGAQFSLSQNQFNASQRQAQEAARENIIKMMSDRSGPADWVAYNRLVNGLAAPTPTSSTISDPFAGLADLYKESNVAAPAIPDMSPASVAYSPSAVTGSFLTPPASQPSAAGGSSALPATGSAGGAYSSGPGQIPGITQNATPPNDGISRNGVTNQPPGYTPPSNGTMGSSAGSLPMTPSYGPGGNLLGQTVDHTQTGSTPIPQFAGGGSTTGAAIVGDRPGETKQQIKNDPHTELTYAFTGPDGKSGFRVLPHQEMVAKVLDKAFGNSNGRVIGAHKMPAGFLDGLPRAAEGGDFGFNDQAGQTQGGTMDPTRQASAQLPPGVGGQFGEAKNPITTQPFQPSPTSAAGTMVDGYPNPTGTAQPSHDPNPTGPISAPGIQANGSSAAANPTGGGITPGMSTPAAATLPPSAVQVGGQASAVAPASAPAAPVGSAPGGNGQPAFVPDAPGTYGGEGYQDWLKTNVYDPSVLGSQPFIQQMNGTAPSREFGGFGATISNPALGIENFNPLFSLQKYNQLSDSAQKQYQSLITQGLGLNWEDLKGFAQKSAPVGHNFQTYAQAIQPATYGR